MPIPTEPDETRFDVAASTACLNCGAHVSEDFARVFGDNHDQVHRCPRCSDQTDLLNGAAVGSRTG